MGDTDRVRRRRTRAHFRGVAVALSILPHCLSQAAPISEEDFFATVPIVLSVTRLAQTVQDAPVGITIIDREMIDASGARELAELFRLVPGFQVGHFQGHRPVVTYHGGSGLQSQRMQVLVDGRSVYLPSINGVFWEDLPLSLDEIERIEVVRGPNAATYGANSFLGAINVITRHASQDSGTAIAGAFGADHVRDLRLRHGGRAGAMDYRLTAGYREDNGYFNKIANVDRTDSYQSRFLTFRGDTRVNDSDTVELYLGFLNGNRGVGEIGLIEQPPHERFVDSSYQHLAWRRVFNPTEELRIGFYHTIRDANQRYLTLPIPVPGLGTTRVPVDFDVFDERYDVELQHTFAPADRWRVVWGGGARRDRVDSERWFDPEVAHTNNLYRLFGNAEWRVTPNTTINTGAMLEKNDITNFDLSPRVALNHRLHPNHSLRTSLSRGSRTPSLVEEYADERYYYKGQLLDVNLVSPGGIDADQATSLEFGYVGETPSRMLQWDVKLFRDRLRVTSASTQPAPFPTLDGTINPIDAVLKATLIGIEGQVKYRPAARTLVVLSGTLTDAEADGDNVAADQIRNYEQSVPKYTINLLARHRFANGVTVSANITRVDDIFWRGEGDQIPGYTRTDVRVARKFNLGRNRGELALVVQNLLDENHDFTFKSQLERRAFATFRLELP